MHFFSPANVMPLLENVRGAKSSARTIATAMAVGSAIGKWPVLVRFRPRPPTGPEVSGSFRKFPKFPGSEVQGPCWCAVGRARPKRAAH